jgi:transcription antitermination factor NusG
MEPQIRLPVINNPPCNGSQTMPDVMQVGVFERGEAGSVPHSAAPSRAAKVETPEAVRLRSHASWLCIHHNGAKGARIRLALRREGCEVHWPRFIERRENQDDVIRPLFRGYMFALPPANLGPALIREIPNIIGVVGVRERGRPDPCDDLVGHLLARAGSLDGVIDETADTRPFTRFREGDRVTVATGALAGLSGLMSSDRGEARVRVLLDVLGGRREVVLPREQVTQ